MVSSDYEINQTDYKSSQ